MLGFQTLILFVFSGAFTARLVPHRSRFISMLILCAFVGPAVIWGFWQLDRYQAWELNDQYFRETVLAKVEIRSQQSYVGGMDVKGIPYVSERFDVVIPGNPPRETTYYNEVFTFSFAHFFGIAIIAGGACAIVMYLSWLAWPRLGPWAPPSSGSIAVSAPSRTPPH